MREPVAGRIRHQLREWNRDLEGRKIAGVCAGLSSQLDVPVTAVRAGFVLLALPMFSGLGIVLYLTLWFLMPSGPGEISGLDRVVQAVTGLTGDALPEPFDDPGDSPRDRVTADRDPL